MKEGDTKKSIQSFDLEGFKSRLREMIGSSSIRGFSRRCGIAEGTIRGYLEGRNMPTLEKLIALAHAGDESVDWLTTGKVSTGVKLEPSTIKTAQMIERLSEENQR